MKNNKTKRKIIWVIIGAIVLSGIYTLLKKDTNVGDYDTAIVEKTGIFQEVSVTGRVSPQEERILAFQKGGKIDRVYVSVGDTVSVGDILLTLDSSELDAQLVQSRAILETERVLLREYESGTRPEEIAIAQTSVSNAKITLGVVEEKLLNVESKADVDINKVYDVASAAMAVVAPNAKETIMSVSDIQETYFTSGSQDGLEISSKKSVAIKELFNVSSAGLWSSEAVSELGSGLYGEVMGYTDFKYDTLVSLHGALRSVRDMLEQIPITEAMTVADKAILTAKKTAVAVDITTIRNHIQLIGVQLATNISAITTAQSGVTSAQNSLLSAEDQLVLKVSGFVPTKVEAQESRVNAAIASVELIKTQKTQMTLRSPITGIVTVQDGRVGTVTGAGQPIVSVISDNSFKIETYIPEVDIAKVMLEDIAEVTLDAYDDNTIFMARVSSFDPAETVIGGVPTYKVELLFDEESALIRPGMTANVDILTEEKDGVFTIPVRSLMTKDGNKYVRVVNSLGEIIETPVVTGLRGSDGTIEIVEGLFGGETIVTFMRN